MLSGSSHANFGANCREFGLGNLIISSPFAVGGEYLGSVPTSLPNRIARVNQGVSFLVGNFLALGPSGASVYDVGDNVVLLVETQVALNFLVKAAR